jgi:hypothetical protein
MELTTKQKEAIQELTENINSIDLILNKYFNLIYAEKLELNKLNQDVKQLKESEQIK